MIARNLAFKRFRDDHAEVHVEEDPTQRLQTSIFKRRESFFPRNIAFGFL